MKTIIVDLDGTLVKCNSFTQFVKYSFRKLPSLRPFISAMVLMRKMRFITHAHCKDSIIRKVSAKAHSGFLPPFFEILNRNISPEVISIIKTNDFSILATAAPAFYAVPWGKTIGFHSIIATNSGKPETRGMQKLQAVLQAGITFDNETTVISDHSDDLPLFRANTSGTNLLVHHASKLHNGKTVITPFRS